MKYIILIASVLITFSTATQAGNHTVLGITSHNTLSSRGSDWNFVNKDVVATVEIETNLLSKLEESLATGSSFESNGTTFKTLSKFVTADGLSGFVVEDAEGKVSTITEY